MSYSFVDGYQCFGRIFCLHLQPVPWETLETYLQPHQRSNTQRTENKTTDVVNHQHSCKLLMMDILMSETCWAHKKWNKIASENKLVFHSSTIHTFIYARHLEQSLQRLRFGMQDPRLEACIFSRNVQTVLGPTQSPLQLVLPFFPGSKAAEAWRWPLASI